MSDLRGRRARWTSAVVIAPGAAAVFVATVSWASDTRPATAPVLPKPASTTSAADAPAIDPARAQSVQLAAAQRLERAATQRRQQRAELAGQLQSARKQLARIRAGERRARMAHHAGAPVYPAGTLPSNGSVGTTGGFAGGTSAGGRAAPPPAQAAPIQAAPIHAAPPPPVQATTGASGKP